MEPEMEIFKGLTPAPIRLFWWRGAPSTPGESSRLRLGRPCAQLHRAVLPPADGAQPGARARRARLAHGRRWRAEGRKGEGWKGG